MKPFETVLGCCGSTFRGIVSTLAGRCGCVNDEPLNFESGSDFLAKRGLGEAFVKFENAVDRCTDSPSTIGRLETPGVRPLPEGRSAAITIVFQLDAHLVYQRHRATPRGFGEFMLPA